MKVKNGQMLKFKNDAGQDAWIQVAVLNGDPDDVEQAYRAGFNNGYEVLLLVLHSTAEAIEEAGGDAGRLRGLAEVCREEKDEAYEQCGRFFFSQQAGEADDDCCGHA